jgi:hypothetical protein
MGKKQLKFLPGIILLLTLFFALFPKSVSADDVSISISPANLQIQAKPPADVWTPFTIENKSNQPVNFIIGYKPFNTQVSSNGTAAFLKNGQEIQGPDKQIFQKIQVVDDNNISHDEIDLGPQQKKRFRLRITIPDNEPTGDYYFSLIFLQNKQEIYQNIINSGKSSQQNVSTLQAGVGLNVLLAIGNIETPIGSIKSFTTPFFRQSGPVAFMLSAFNGGEHFTTSHGTILIKNMFGQTVGKVVIPSTVILAGTSRMLTGIQTNNYANNYPGSSQQNSSEQIFWPEHFLLGPYIATLSLSFSDNGPTYTRSIYFFAFPFYLLLEILIGLVVILYVYLQVKKKISK